jgi:protein SCO1/2
MPLLFLSLWLALPPADPEGRLPAIKTAPDFKLIDANEKETTLTQFRGKVVLVGFVFTTCNGSCPATTHRMAKVQQAVAQQADLKDKVQLLSITLDPERDRPAVLRDYRLLYDIDTANWSFVTGPANEVQKTIAAWGMWARAAPNGQLDHPSRVFLVDSHGRIREIYNLDFLRVPWVIEDIRLLLNDAP